MSLPPSSDKEFWGENETEVFDKPQVNTGEHYFFWKGDIAICVKCPGQHTAIVDSKKFDIKDGQFVKRD